MLKAWLKKLDQMIHGRAAFSFFSSSPRSRVDYAREVGPGFDSSVIMAPILWIARTMPEARLVVKRDDMEVDDHPLVELVESPNPGYTAEALFTATAMSYCLDGNAYWLKVRNGARGTAQLWYVPHWLIEPRWDESGRDFITSYEYQPGGGAKMMLEPEDVLHFRFGIDPQNTRKGFSPMRAMLREIFTDTECANFAASLLKNQGVPGLIISPSGDTTIGVDDVKAVKDYVSTQFSGANRGAPMVLGAKTDVREFGFSPDKMALESLRNISEERVCAMLGVPSAVVGFGTGMEQTAVGATMNELRRLAWNGAIIPMQRAFAAELERNLLPEMDTRGASAEVCFDTSEVKAMQDDLQQLTARLDVGVRGGWITVAEARDRLGLDVEPQHEIFLRPLGAIEVPADGSEEPAPPAPAAGKPPTAANSSPEGTTSPGEEGTLPPVNPPKARRGPIQRKARRMTQVQQRLYKAMEKLRRKQQRLMQAQFEAFFDDYGQAVAAAYKRAFSKKASGDELNFEQFWNYLNEGKFDEKLGGQFGVAYVRAFKGAKEVAESVVGLTFDVPDTVQIELMSLGASRSKLVGLGGDDRAEIFDKLTEWTDEGLGTDEIARNLAEIIPAGPWSSSKIRAEVVARTESRIATTRASLQVYKNMTGATAAQMIDARMGDTDPDCEAIDGQVVSFADAQKLIDDEHPNGTRDLVPVFGEEE